MSGYTALYMVAWAQAGRRKSDVFRWFDRTSWGSWSHLKGRDIELGGWAHHYGSAFATFIVSIRSIEADVWVSFPGDLFVHRPI